MLGASAWWSVGIALSEDRQPLLEETVSPAGATQSARVAAAYPQLRATTSYKIAMSPHRGTGDIDLQIQDVQRRIHEAIEPRPLLEKLGWLYVVKARTSYDPGFYKLAEQCALTLEVAEPNSLEALLLRGHLLINFHRFSEAEAIARKLVAQRTFPPDYALLGDALLEQGSVDEAVTAYQHMVDLRPDLQSYGRVAHLRWVKGDIDGAIEVAQLAVGCTSPLDPEFASWILARLALYHFQAGSLSEAKSACQAALKSSPNYPPALLLEGRFLLSENKATEAISSVQRAAAINPLPEFQWALADALRLAGRTDDGAKTEAALKHGGAESDPRTLALFLATRGEQIEFAIELAQREFQSRADVFTHDALAWALVAAGRLDEARPSMEKALAEGTIDARLFLHAGVLEARLGHTTRAESYLTKARELERMLLPSERQHLVAALDTLTTRRDSETLSARDDLLAKTSSPEQRKDRNEE